MPRALKELDMHANNMLDIDGIKFIARDFCREVFAESIKTEYSAYDLFYIVLARRHIACILTEDKKMINTLQVN